MIGHAVPVCLLLVGIFASGARARVLSVPNDVLTIQAGIDSAANGDTVLAEVNRYYENIDFHGRNIVVASRFILDTNLVWVAKTVIDGSRPANPDTASCVRIVSGEDTTCQLVGFTITGGTGTKWQDEHGAGLFREGGGILLQASSPVIRNNIITGNQATDRQGCASAGGGGIRAGDGNPRILNCVVDNNHGRYGAGIVLNYCGATIRNTIVASNSGGEDYGGGGVWAYADGASPKLFENCAIAYNHSALMGGGMRFWSTGGPVRNCIVWANTAQTGPQIFPTTGGPPVTYSDVQGGWTGDGNIDADPDWGPGSLMLRPTSPCVDTGNPDPAYHDPDSAGVARWPALGGLRNDMGAYGGPLAMELGASVNGTAEESHRPVTTANTLSAEPVIFNRQTRFRSPMMGPGMLAIYDVSGARVRSVSVSRAQPLVFAWDGTDDVGAPVAAGAYACMLTAVRGTAMARVILVR